MIIINLSGGLGNQMFQYAFGKAISQKKGFELKLDANYYFSKKCLENDCRKYLLDKFNVSSLTASTAEVKKIYPIWKKVLRKIRVKMFGLPNPFSFNPEEISNKDNKYYIGFWQNEKYFLDIKNIIVKDFTLKNELSGAANDLQKMIINEKSSVSIHVRRTDILDPKNKYSGICDINYYNTAVSLIMKQVDNLVLFVFSDDIAWAKENLKFPYPMNFVSCPEIPDYEELILMSKCKHNIIANSTFSWWGAWLNQNPDKIVIAPKKWLDICEDKYEDVIPKAWTKI